MEINNLGNQHTVEGSGFNAGGIEELGGQQFLQLLVAQIQNQDPMNPMEDRDFIAQMAQFSTLTQMQSAVRNQMTMLGAGLLGRRFVLKSSSGEQIEGKIVSAAWQDGEMMLTTDAGDELPMGQISSMQVAAETEG